MHLEIDRQDRIRLPTGRVLNVRGLTLGDILERWPGTLCGPERMAESIAIGPGGQGPRLLRDEGPPLGVSIWIEPKPFPSEREIMLGRISNGSLIILPSPPQ
jgi:hypothetical protein